MSWINYDWNNLSQKYELGIKPNDTDLKCFKLSKTRVNNNSCSTCSKTIPPKSWVFGQGYTKICLDCSDDFFDKAYKVLKEVKNKLKKEQKIFWNKKETLIKENMLNSL